MAGLVPAMNVFSLKRRKAVGKTWMAAASATMTMWGGCGGSLPLGVMAGLVPAIHVFLC